MSRPPATSTDTTDRSVLPAELDPGRLPQHVALIMDGNGRWAKSRGLPRVMGHRAGVEALKSTLRLCSDWGIQALTAYAFSTENWSRPGEEVKFLMTLFERVLQNLLENAIKYRGERPARIHVSCERRPGEVVLGVRDHGIGVDPVKDFARARPHRRPVDQTEPGAGLVPDEDVLGHR